MKLKNKLLVHAARVFRSVTRLLIMPEIGTSANRNAIQFVLFGVLQVCMVNAQLKTGKLTETVEGRLSYDHHTLVEKI
jgi:hypothetical protein